MTIDELNEKFQVVQKNKYWNQDIPMLFEIASRLNRDVEYQNIDLPDARSYSIEGITFEEMKEVVYNFFMNINPDLKTRLDKIFENINVLSDEGRSFASEDGINFHFDDSLSSLITLAHEVSHRISSMDKEGNINNKNKIGEFAEVEAELTEEAFLDYLKDNNLEVINNTTEEVKPLDDEIINGIQLNKMNGIMNVVYRSLDELSFKELLNKNNFNKLSPMLINSIGRITNMNEENVINRINNIIDNYYPHNGEEVVDGYDLHNGRQLSNEARFIYAHLFASKLKEMDLSLEERNIFYKNYLDNNKNMTFNDMLNTFNVDLDNPFDITNSFVNNYEEMINNSYGRKR